jgi:hypothetical protein
MTKRTRALKEQKAMKAMKVLLRKYNLEEDADKFGACVQNIIDIACITQSSVEYFKLKGTVAQYMDIVRNETGKEPEAIKAEYVKSSTKSQKRK